MGGGAAMARYLSTETLKLEPETRAMAHYYGGEALPLSAADRIGQLVADGSLSYGEALDAMMGAAIQREDNRSVDVDTLESRIGTDLTDAVSRMKVQREITASGGTIARVRPDMDPRLAERLGIDLNRQPTEMEIGNLLAGRRADAGSRGDRAEDPGRIEGKQQHAPMRSVVDVFGIAERTPPQGEAVRNVLAGKRADGQAPRTPDGEILTQAVIDGARRRFLSMMDVPSHRDATPAEVEHMVVGRTACGLGIAAADYHQRANATNAPIAYVDFVFSADKSVSTAWALAPTEAERAAILQVHNDAVAGAMAHAEHLLGHAGIGKSRSGGTEPADMAWLTFGHFTSRPAVDLVARDAAGLAFTDPREVPVAADPQVHSHVTAMNALLTETGRIGSLDLDRLSGAIKEIGAVYQALIAQGARKLGADVVFDERTGAARLAAVPETARTLFSGRHNEGEVAARSYAASKGMDWDALGEPQKRALLEAGSNTTRRGKGSGGNSEGVSDFAGWEKRAHDAGYTHRSVLRPDEILPEPGLEQRRAVAYEAALPMIERELSRRATLGEGDLREIAARGLIVAGIGNPAEDIAAVTQAFAQRGVRQDGRETALIIGEDVPVRGKRRISVTTALHADQEADLIVLARKGHADRSGALSAAAIGRAADRSGLDFTTEHGRAQRAMMETMAAGGRLVVAIGAAGAGKTSMLAPVVAAWKEAGEDRSVFGATLAWKQAGALDGAGIETQHRAAIDPFLKRAESGKYALNEKSLVVIDEVGLLGTRQLLRLMQLQDKHGFKLIAVGDPAQCQAIEAGPVIDLLRKAIGPEAVPEILTTLRQKTEREREIAGLFREGRAAEALEKKREDGTVRLVAGGQDRTVQAVADLWRERMEANQADPAYRLTVTAPTNADARALGGAIRERQRDMGLIGADALVVSAVDRNTREKYAMPLAVGDRVRLFDRVHDDARTGKRAVLASNGDVVEIRQLSDRGMVVRNADGDEGLVKWSKLQAGQGAPVRLAYGAALTIDSAQGITSTEHIAAMPSGTRAVNSFKGYTSASRHERTMFMVIDEATERREVSTRQPLGTFKMIREPDIWENAARNLSRTPRKTSATEFLATSLDAMRGTTRGLQLGMEPAERRKRSAAGDSRILHSLPERRLMSVPYVVSRVMHIARAAQARLIPKQRVRQPEMPRQRSGPTIGM